MTLSLSSEPQARSLTDRESHRKKTNPMRVKGMSASMRVREVRGQVPGTTCNGARTNSANNTCHELLKSREGVARRYYDIKRQGR